MPTSVRPRTRFAADAMLGSLARKLRAFGFDVAYYRSGDDAGILRVARSGGRILITSDRELAARGGSHGVQSVLISRNNDASRISELAAGCSARGIELVRGEPMCSLCGGELEHLPRREAGGLVSSSVLAWHRHFLRCDGCGHVYWKGSHWKKLRSMARRLG